ncbi:MAG TPA: L,D-transpeptidase [Longimicrobiales bacterium]|nr:L,D-transpeptidase [Longimicrobiales bacterium]
MIVPFLLLAALAGTGTAVAPAAARVQGEHLTAMAADSDGVAVLRAADRVRGAKILVSTKQRWLWFVVAKDTLLSVPVAVGMNSDFVYEDKKFHFATPIGRRKVLKKEEHPIWTVPEWHYMEKAKARSLELVRLGARSKVELEDGSTIVVQGDQVGRVNQFGNFWAFTPGTEIVFDGKIFMPPISTVQRRVPEALGPYKLDTGNGYLIHGTHIYNEDSVGEAVSHGCVRMDNFDLERLYYMVDTGTPVFIF